MSQHNDEEAKLVKIATESTISHSDVYGSFNSSNDGDYVDYDEESGSRKSSFSNGSFRRSMLKVNPENVLLRVKPPLLLRHHSLAEQFAMAPTEMAERMQLISDPCLENDDEARGQLYYSEEAYYNPKVEPSYALTVRPEIFQQVLDEVVEARQVPCGLYFCCHGGDGAHTGVSHDDYVDITIAWILMGSFLGVLLYLG